MIGFLITICSSVLFLDWISRIAKLIPVTVFFLYITVIQIIAKQGLQQPTKIRTTNINKTGTIFQNLNILHWFRIFMHPFFFLWCNYRLTFSCLLLTLFAVGYLTLVAEPVVSFVLLSVVTLIFFAMGSDLWNASCPRIFSVCLNIDYNGQFWIFWKKELRFFSANPSCFVSFYR